MRLGPSVPREVRFGVNSAYRAQRCGVRCFVLTSYCVATHEASRDGLKHDNIEAGK